MERHACHHRASPPVENPAAVVYTCPMHPEVERIGPGVCPFCGMALEPRAFILDDSPDPELVDMTRRFRIGAVLGLPVLLLAMGEHLWGHWIAAHLSVWLQFALSTPVVLWGGWPFFRRAWTSIVTGHLNMFTLIGLGAGIAYAYSAVAASAPQLFPDTLRIMAGRPAVYFEAAAVIVTLALLGQVLELRARHRTAGAIRALLDRAPKTARRADDDTDVPLDRVRVGDRLRVRPGEAVPVDGVVESGHGTVDRSMLTGEPLPVEVGPGDAMTGGTLSRAGTLVMRAERLGRDTMLARIVQLVAEAQRSRAPVQGLADRVAGVFVPGVMTIAVVTAAVWGLWGPEPRPAFALANAVAVLIIACPCVLGLATPMSIMVGIGRGALAGVLVRNAAALDRLERVDTLVVDKTGTLTEGRPRLARVVAADETGLLRLAASLERASIHPLAESIVIGATERGIALTQAENVEALDGLGLVGTVEGRAVVLGNAALMAREDIATTASDAAARAAQQAGETTVFVAVDGQAVGLLGIADPVKANARQAIADLKREGLRLVMLTGDTRATAAAVADRLGIDEVIAGVLPDGKAEVVGALQDRGCVVAMAGDGINDAPALARADVGIAMGTGADVALESADVTLLGGDLAGLVRARRLSRATMRNIRQNLIFAFLYNVLGVPIAAGVLYPVFGLLLGPIVASAAMSLSSVSVVGNALRLRHTRLEGRP